MTSPTADIAGAMAVTRAVGRFLLVQAVLLAASLTLYGWTPYLLWLAPLATTFQLYLRVRKITENACTTMSSYESFTHTPPASAGWLVRTTLQPYWFCTTAETHIIMSGHLLTLPQN